MSGFEQAAAHVRLGLDDSCRHVPYLQDDLLRGNFMIGARAGPLALGQMNTTSIPSAGMRPVDSAERAGAPGWPRADGRMSFTRGASS